MEKKKTPEEAIIQGLEDILDNYTYEQYFTDDEYEAALQAVQYRYRYTTTNNSPNWGYDGGSWEIDHLSGEVIAHGLRPASAERGFRRGDVTPKPDATADANSAAYYHYQRKKGGAYAE